SSPPSPAHSPGARPRRPLPSLVSFSAGPPASGMKQHKAPAGPVGSHWGSCDGIAAASARELPREPRFGRVARYGLLAQLATLHAGTLQHLAVLLLGHALAALLNHRTHRGHLTSNC